MREINVMIDLETTGIKPGCCVLSIGATTFSGPEYRRGEESLFYQQALHEDQYGKGLVDAESTMAWWAQQSDEARQEAFKSENAVELGLALSRFAGYLECLGKSKDIYVWGNAASFDLKILEHAYHACGLSVPWYFRNERCYRTLESLYGNRVPKRDFKGVRHNALADAVYQAERACDLLRATGRMI